MREWVGEGEGRVLGEEREIERGLWEERWSRLGVIELVKGKLVELDHLVLQFGGELDKWRARMEEKRQFSS